jgi:dTDP-4-dehydrorhamnose reductase
MDTTQLQQLEPLSKRILITGGSGMLGVNCALQLRHCRQVVLALHTRKLSIQGVHSLPLALDTAESAMAAISAVNPNYVIHTAALSSVDRCEADPLLALHVNVELAANVAAACAKLNIGLVHVSTDHLFDGGKPLADEETPLSPMNRYGQSKAEAEQEVLAAHPESLLIRTNFYGFGPPWRPSFSDVILDGLRAGRELGLFTDVYYSPLLLQDLIHVMLELMEGGYRGIFNVVGDQRLSKYEFGLLLAATFGLDPSPIKPVQIASMPHFVQRPKDMSLSNAKLVRTLGRAVGDVHSQLLRMRQLKISGFKAELDGLSLHG